MSGVVPLGVHLRARWVAGWARGWQVLMAMMVLLVLALTPSSYSVQRREDMARQLVRATWPHVLWFTLLAALLGVVLIQIVVVTAQSYGLSQYALEMVVRVLVLELLPLMAALFVALRWSLPTAAELVGELVGELAGERPQAPLSEDGHVAPAPGQFGHDPVLDARQVNWLTDVALPPVLAGVFSVWLLVAVSSVLGLGLAYVLVYGLTPWGLEAYTHMVGRVFNAVVPLASLVPQAGATPSLSTLRGLEVQGLVRMTGVLLLVELVSLVGNYY